MQQWLTSLLESGDAAGLLQHYRYEVELHAAIVWASAYGKPAFAGMRDRRVPLIVRLCTDDGTHGDSLRTALALGALATLDALPSGEEVERTIRSLTSVRQADGG